MSRSNPGCPDNPLPSVAKQISEDTCREHGVFCCPQCFNMGDSGLSIEIDKEDDND